MRDFLGGALAMAYCVAALFFLRFWRDARDRLFALFATAFLVLALQRVLLVAASRYEWNTTWAYGLRLAAFVLILVAIVEKNRVGRN